MIYLKASCDVLVEATQLHIYVSKASAVPLLTLRQCRLHFCACFNKLVSFYKMHQVAGSEFRALYSAAMRRN